MNRELSIQRYLAKVPVSIEGCGGSRALYHACASIIIAFHLSAEEAADAILASGWNEQCQPPWEEKDIRRCCKNAHRDVQNDTRWFYGQLTDKLRKNWNEPKPAKKEVKPDGEHHDKEQSREVEKPLELIRIKHEEERRYLEGETIFKNGYIYRQRYAMRGPTEGCYFSPLADTKYAKAVWCFEYADGNGAPYLLYKRIDTNQITSSGKTKKFFLDYRWDPVANAYIRGTKGLVPVPFRLASFPYFENIFIVEGEKCAVALNYYFAMRAGLRDTCLATTVPHGAGAWKDSYNIYFSGKCVCVLPDNDDVGFEGARKIQAQLRPYCRECYTITEYPEYLKEHGDIYDVLKEMEARD